MRNDPDDGGDTRWMGRFHALSERVVNERVTVRAPGNYALGYFDGSSFTVFYVGRSDSDLRSCLEAWVGAPSRPRHHRASPQAPWRSRSGPLTGLGTRGLGRTAVGIDTAYTHFAFCYASSPMAAFRQECLDYHELGGSECLDNQRPPDRPSGAPWDCSIPA
jgi:hypothetical protein